MAEILDDCLENFETEDVGRDCEIEDIDSGVSEHVYYALAEHVEAITLPDTTTDKSFAGAVTIDQAITMLTGKYFSKINLQVDLNELKSNYVGNTGNQKINSTLEAFIAGTKPQLVGMQKKMKNKRVVMIVPDNNGQHWILGLPQKPARITTFDIATGKTDEDNNGATLNILTKTNLYLYKGAIPLAPAGTP